MPVMCMVLNLGSEFCSFSLKVSTMDFPAGIDKDAAVQFLSAKVDSNLTRILQEADVPIELQYNLCQSFKTVRRFSTYEDERAKVREALKNDFRVDGATSLAHRAAVAAVISAWEACQQFAVKEQELKAEARVLGVPRPITQTDRAAMRTSFVAAHGSIEDSLEPSDDYLSAKAEELESHEPSASPLNEVTSKRSTKTLGIQTSIDAGGQIRIVRNKQKGSLPQGTEELRTTLRIEANMWCFLAAKFRNREMLRGMSPACWDDYVNFLLGDKCYLMKIHGGKGNEATPLRPPWHILINFEHELRREAVKRAHNENRPLKDTLPEVCKDSELKERYFTSPIALQPRALKIGNKRPWEPKGAPWYKGKGKGWQEGIPVPDPAWKWLRKESKGKQQKGKGSKGKASSSKSGHGLTDRTPDGREICFAFNAQGCDGSCGRIHVCRVKGCNEAHAMWQHFQKLSISSEGKNSAAMGN